MRPIKSAVLAGTSLAVALSLVTACGEKSGEQSGAGGAMNAAGFGAAGAAGNGAAGMGGANPNSGGAPFMPPPVDAGACRKLDEPCERTPDCCGGLLCNRNGPVAGMNGCKTPCTQNSECPSGCCYKFINSNDGMCADTKWCTCGGTGAACSPTMPPCCNTHQCQGGMCNQKCIQNSECATQCCVPVTLLPGTSTCLDPMYCP